jgi:lipopolysaccharide export system permease protein
MMPSLLDRLIARQILHSTLLVLNVLVALAVFFVLIDALKDYGEANFGLAELIKYVVLRQPQQVYELAPIGALIGTIMGLTTLALNSELTAMRAAGVSVARIVLAAMKVGLLFALVILLVGEYVVPVAENMAQTGRARALETPLQKKSTGIWLRSGTSYVNIGEVLPDFSLLRMNIYDFGQDNRLRSQVFARRAHYRDGVWRLQRVKESLIVGDEAVQTRQVAEEDWRSALTPDVVSVFAIRPESLSIRQLHYYVGHLRQNNQDTRSFRLAFWQKSFMPLAILIMVLLATPFVFRQIRSGGLSHRVFIGIMLGLVFIIFHKSLGYFGAVYALPPVVASLLPIAVFFVLALFLLRRAARGL